MTFSHPEWFLLLPALLLLGLVIKRVQIFKPLRIISLVLITLLLTKPSYNAISKHLDLWVLLDRSDSTEGLIDKGFPEWKKIIEASKPSHKDQTHYIDYASSVSVQEVGGERATYTGSRKLTRTQLALEDVLARRKENRPSRIVIFTDGYATEPLHEIAAKLAAQGVPVDFRLVSENETDDFRIARLHTPTQIQVGEPFLLSATVKGHSDIEVPITIFRDGEPLTESKVHLKNGVGKVEFTTRIQQAGSYQFAAKIHPTMDTHDGNNYAERWLQVTGGPRVLLVTNYTNDPLAEVLRKQNYAVDVVEDSETLKIGQLAGTKSVIFNNVPAHEIPNNFLNSLDFYVKEQGGGFLMIGGKHSFAAGGYYNSAVDDLLPVSMELKNDHRKLSVALAIVMDRSGSMSMTVNAPGAGGITKMDLANNGAAEAIRLLGQRDEIAIYAVDSEAHTIVPLQAIGTNKQALIKKAKRVISSGGGIYVYNGLKAAWDDLKTSSIGTKHIILFSDASDTEQPGDYVNLLGDIEQENGSVSVIGLGSNTDQDARLLEEIARLGNGRIFYSTNALDIPKLFAQETVTLARSAFLTDPVKTQAVGHWKDISDKPLQFLPQIDAYNLSYAKNTAITSLISQDEYVAPLICHWKKGMGRTAAITFPMGGDFSESSRSWQSYGNFSQTLVNWLNGDRFPPGISVKHRLEGTRLTIDLYYDTSVEGQNWSKTFALDPPRIRLQEQEGEVYDLTWKRIAPGHYSLSKDLEEGVLVKGAIQAGNYALPFGPLIVGSNTEWTFDPDRVAELKSLSLQTGGKELTDISKVWVRPEISKQQSLLIPLSIALLLMMLLDALQTRIGWKLTLPKLNLKRTQVATEIIPASTTSAEKPKKAKPTKKVKANVKEANTKVEAEPQAPAQTKLSRAERFAKAKKRK